MKLNLDRPDIALALIGWSFALGASTVFFATCVRISIWIVFH